MNVRPKFGILFIVSTTLFAGCSGGGGGTTMPSSPTSTPTNGVAASPTPSPTPSTLVTNSATVSVAAAQAAPQSLPLVSAFGGTLQLVGASAASGVSLTILDSDAPVSLPALLFRGRAATAHRFLESAYQTLGYVYLTPSAPIALASFPTFAFTPSASALASLGANPSFYLAYYDPAIGSWNAPIEGPEQLSSGSVTFADALSARSLVLQSGVTYGFALYAYGSGAPTPQPSPTATSGATATPTAGPSATATPTATASATPTISPTAAPTATPTANPTTSPTTSPIPVSSPTAAPPGTLVVTPSSLAFTSLNGTQTFAASESGYSGSFAATSANAKIATVSSSDNLHFVVTPIAAGATTINVADSYGQSASVAIAVTTTTVTGQ